MSQVVQIEYRGVITEVARNGRVGSIEFTNVDDFIKEHSEAVIGMWRAKRCRGLVKMGSYLKEGQTVTGVAEANGQKIAEVLTIAVDNA